MPLPRDDGGLDLSAPLLAATRARLVARFGAAAERWWDQLPALLPALADRWSLTLDSAVGRGNTSLVIRCRRSDGAHAMLKVTPEAELAAAEAAALRSWQASGRVPQVWEDDAAHGALLLEAVPSETPLMDSGRAVEPTEIATLILALHDTRPQTAAAPVGPLADRVEFVFAHWIARHAGSRHLAAPDPVLADLHRGRQLARALAAEATPAVLLHGDLHPGNVLDGGPARGLVAIDPRPCLGDAAFDVVDWVFWGASDPQAWRTRSHQLSAALGIEESRLWAWCAALAPILAASEASSGSNPQRVEVLLMLPD